MSQREEVLVDKRQGPNLERVLRTMADIFDAVKGHRVDFDSDNLSITLLEAADSLAAKDAEIARLRKALKPFAEMWLWEKEPDHSILRFKSPTNDVTEKFCQIFAGDTRNARAAQQEPK